MASGASSDKKLTLAEFESLGSRNISLLTSASSEKIADVHDTILNTVHDLATSGDNTPTQLLALQHLADFPARAEIREQRLELDHQKFEHKQEMDTFRKDMAQKRFDLAQKSFAFRQQVHEDRLQIAEKRLQPSGSQPSIPQSDQQGPFARTREDISERVRIRIGISKEEAARRAALRKAHREEQARLAAQQPQAHSSLSEPANALPAREPLDEPTRPCSADFQSAVSSSAFNVDSQSGSPVAAVCDRRSASSPPPDKNLNLLDLLKTVPAEYDTARIVKTPSLINTQLELGVSAPHQNENRFNGFSEPPAETTRPCNADFQSAAPQSNSASPSAPLASSAPSALTLQPSPLSLLDRVNQYNLARNREAEHGKNPHKVGKWNAWNFKSKMQFCPCGHATLPCPQHGWFRPEFFELSCDSADYWAVLDAKRLPYTALCHIDTAERDRLENLQNGKYAPP